MRPDGKTLITNNPHGPEKIPEGTYDIGDGFYDPLKRIICKYDGQFARELYAGEEDWITKKCRYNPRAPIEGKEYILTGDNDPIIEKMKMLNQKSAKEKGIK